MGGRVMSPGAPKEEMRGMQVAMDYYSRRIELSRIGIIQSAELLREYFTKSQGYSFAYGFVVGATIIAQTRT